MVVMTKGLDIEQYKNDNGFELIAVDLEIDYPSRSNFENINDA